MPVHHPISQEDKAVSRPPSPRDLANAAVRRPLATNYGRFETPERLAGDVRLSPTVRIRLLKEWDQDLTARLRATDENMAGDEAGSASELLRRVRVCLERLEPPDPRH